MNQPLSIPDRLFLGLCAALLLTPLALTQWNNHADLKTERRPRAAWPKVPTALAVWRQFPGQFDQALQDRIGLREKAREYWAAAHYLALRESVDPRVVIGQEPWLFFRVEPTGAEIENTLADMTESQPVLDKTVRLALEKLQNRHRWAKDHGVRYLFAAVPNKSTIYRNLGPDWMQRSGFGRPLTQLDEAWAKRHGTDHPWLSLEPALRAHAGETNIYFHTDTHWNELGAFYGVQAMAQQLAKDFPGLRVPQLADFAVTWITWGGLDLGHMLGAHAWLRDHHPKLTVRPGLELPPFQRDMKVLFYHDSFGGVLPHLWLAYFPNTEFHLYHHFDREEILADKAQLAISLLVERSLRDLRKY